MASALKLIGSGMPALQANQIGLTVGTYIGIGTAQATATPITTNTALLTTSGGATAFVLSTIWAIGDTVTVFNTSATTALIYPPSGSSIDGGSTDASVSLAQNAGNSYTKVTSTTWRSATGVAGLNPAYTTLTVSGAATIGGVTTPTGGIAMAGGSAAPTVWHSGQVGANSTTMGTDTTPVVTQTYIVEVFVPVNCTLTGVSVLNGSAVAGNMQISLADSAGAVITAAQTVSTAASGTAGFQKVPFATPYAAIGPAKFFILLQNNNTSNRFRSHAVGNFGASVKTGETYGTFTAVTPPTTFTTGTGPVADVY